MTYSFRIARTLAVALLLLHLLACSRIPFLNRDKDADTRPGEESSEPLVEVIVNGVDDTVADNIRAHVGISRSRCSVPVELLRRRVDKTGKEAVSALQAYGYYQANVSVTFSSTEACPLATIDVEPGPAMKVRKVELIIKGEAAGDPEFAEMTDDLPLKQGDDLNHGLYSKIKSRIESAAAELGYLEGRFITTELTVNMEDYAADAMIHYDSGVRYRLGDIRLKQEPEILREDLVRRLLEAPTGNSYRAEQVVRLQDRLGNSGYFSRVEARPQLGVNEEKSIPVDVSMSPADRHAFSVSLGFATDEGIRSRLGYTNRWWNDRGHRLGAETRLSQTEQGVSANYQIPREFPSNEWLQFTLGLRQQDVDTFETQSGRFSISDTKRRPWGIMENRFVSISREDFTIGEEEGIGTFLIPGLRWDRRYVDNELTPNRGLDLDLEIRGASDSLISDTSFARMSFNAHYLQAIPFGLRAYLRTNLGAMWVDQFRALPPSERFFAGGDNSIRGYDFQDLGPVNRAGDVIGGSYLGVISFELEKYLYGNWGVAGFVDTGNAFGGPGSNTGLKTGAGIGLRWRSPVGPVRIDLAHPLDDEDTLVRVHIRIGPDI